MITITKSIEKRIVPVFVFAFFIELIFKVLFNIWDDSKLDMIHGIWIMIASSLLVVYSIYDLYTLVYNRKHYFYYTIKFSMVTLLFIHTVLYIINNLVFYLLYIDYDNANILGKAISLLSFYVLNMALLIVFRSFSNIKLGSTLYMLFLLIISLGYPIAYSSLNQDSMKNFMIGTASGDHTHQIYTAIIPITIMQGDTSYLMHSTLFINCLIIIISTVIYLMFSRKRCNW